MERCVLHSFIGPSLNNPTIEDRYKITLCFEGKEYEIEILNTAGEEYDERFWICRYHLEMDLCLFS